MPCSWRYFAAAFSIFGITWVPQISSGQAPLSPAEKITHSIGQRPLPVLLKDPGLVDAAPTLSDNGESKIRTRQALILSGVAVSMLAYGYFVLQFNNSRTDSDQARLAYEADVRENAQEYIDQGVELDQIPSYFAWERAFTNAANDRELAAVAGLSAFLLSLAAILDSATADTNQGSSSQAKGMSPVLDVSPWTGDVRLGARIGL